GGDGFFLSNHADLGKPEDGPCDDNLIALNDGSWSPCNAFEATFSSGNMFLGNLANHSRFGFWCGYSSRSLYSGNQICDNLEGGIATEHGADHVIEKNEISRNGVAVQFWQHPERGSHPSKDITVRNNTIAKNRIGVEVKETAGLAIENNVFDEN